MIDLNNFRKNIYHKFGFKECPHYGEDGVILEIFNNVPTNKTPLVIEFGETRVLGTTTRAFRVNYISKSIYFTLNISLLSKIYNILDIFKITFKSFKFSYLKFFMNLPFSYFADKDSIIKLFKNKKIKNIDILTIDIDSYDYVVAKNILENKYRPTLFIIEYNPNLPIEDEYIQPEGETFINKKLYGCNYGSLVNLFKKNNYYLIHISGFCNLFFLDNKYRNIFIEPNIINEITDNDDKIEIFIKKYCQKNFKPSWFYEKKLEYKDIKKFKIN